MAELCAELLSVDLPPFPPDLLVSKRSCPDHSPDRTQDKSKSACHKVGVISVVPIKRLCQ